MSCQCWSCGRGTSCDVEFCAKCNESLRVEREGAAKAARSVKVNIDENERALTSLRSKQEGIDAAIDRAHKFLCCRNGESRHSPKKCTEPLVDDLFNLRHEVSVEIGKRLGAEASS